MGKITKTRSMGKTKPPSAVAPASHGSGHENGGSDEIDISGLAGRQIYVPYSLKIATINESDTNSHTFDLETAMSETRTIIGVYVGASRTGGTGHLKCDPNEAGNLLRISAFFDTDIKLIIIAAGTQRLKYSQTVANDTFDLYCLGYVVVTT